VGEKIRLVDSADAIASYLKRLIPEEPDGAMGTDSFFVSDNEAKFLQIYQNILESPIMSLKRVRLFESWFTDEI
jgi:glutamate racemase